MTNLGLGVNVLAIGAHPDDIELGCGGALLAHRRAGHNITMLVMTDGSANSPAAVRTLEQQTVARRLDATLLWGGFHDGDIPAGKTAVQTIDRAIETSGAHVVYTHAPNDAHQDHRSVASASLAAARNIASYYAYETPSTSAFTPNVYLAIDDLLAHKIELIEQHHSQIARRGRVDPLVVEAQARVRGHHGRLGLAEAFESPRSQLVIPSDLTMQNLTAPGRGSSQEVNA